MKRRLPTIRKGEAVLAAISLPPLTDDANRHRPSRPAIPASPPPRRMPRRSRPAQTGPAQRRADRLPAQLHRQRRERDAELPGARPEPPHPAPRRRMRHPRPGRRRPDPARAARPPARSPRRPSRPDPAARPARTPAAAHGSPGTGRTAPWARRSSGTGPPPGHAASNQTRTPAARRTTGRPGAGPPPPGQPPHKHRPAAGTAIRWPRATHRLGSLPAIGANEARRDPSRSPKTGKSWPAQRQPGGDIVKKHGQTRGRDAQEIRPSHVSRPVASQSGPFARACQLIWLCRIAIVATCSR